jgi:3-dehydroquinate synthase
MGRRLFSATTPSAGGIALQIRVVPGGSGTEAGRTAAGYDVRIGPGLLAAVGESLRTVCPATGYAVIADSRIAELYGERVRSQAEGSGARAELLTFAAGEGSKNRTVWAELSDRMLAAGFGRDAAVLALGGGVTGDLAGFVAATYLRGLPLVQIPTSLLAMIDSSVGGKTGVDTPAGKNLIGAFHQPVLVLADTTTLDTLPPRELRSGLAEAVKHGAIADAAYFEWIDSARPALLHLDDSALPRLIHRSVQIKADVVATDERETGLRKILNFGHTAGHAVEALSGFDLLHGEAIAIGMVVEAEIGESLGVTRAGTAGRLRRVLAALDLPVEVPPAFDPAAILELTRVDKKARAGRVEYALVAEIGRAHPGAGGYGTPVDDSLVLRALRKCGARRIGNDIQDVTRRE